MRERGRSGRKEMNSLDFWIDLKRLIVLNTINTMKKAVNQVGSVHFPENIISMVKQISGR